MKTKIVIGKSGELKTKNWHLKPKVKYRFKSRLEAEQGVREAEQQVIRHRWCVDAAMANKWQGTKELSIGVAYALTKHPRNGRALVSGPLLVIRYIHDGAIEVWDVEKNIIHFKNYPPVIEEARELRDALEWAMDIYRKENV